MWQLFSDRHARLAPVPRAQPGRKMSHLHTLPIPMLSGLLMMRSQRINFFMEYLKVRHRTHLLHSMIFYLRKNQQCIGDRP
ncbi:unnamed protein product [Chondrus crispus]|uniref:Uncharacterized protein n=1 Tax=Chondrus crispus TaxID=2769 RepID=R7QJZ6_CHOCR|nr:unnamed protein product [Chondrus crispus]CDF37801.1 unnamed protein product [Chondrus crispus]|eukprot:XP_005717672.1 unnamed protein product [Chondrus crispus]